MAVPEDDEQRGVRAQEHHEEGQRERQGREHDLGEPPALLGELESEGAT